jgi:hypothetical protein
LPYTVKYHGEAQVKVKVEVETPFFVTLTLPSLVQGRGEDLD